MTYFSILADFHRQSGKRDSQLSCSTGNLFAEDEAIIGIKETNFYTATQGVLVRDPNSTF